MYKIFPWFKKKEVIMWHYPTFSLILYNNDNKHTNLGYKLSHYSIVDFIISSFLFYGRCLLKYIIKWPTKRKHELSYKILWKLSIGKNTYHFYHLIFYKFSFLGHMDPQISCHCIQNLKYCNYNVYNTCLQLFLLI